MKTDSNLFARRHFLHVLTGGATAAVTGAAARPRSAAAARPTRSEKKPNIVIFISDDHGILDSGCYGNTIIRTPNIDGLAREGMRFTHAFTPTAMCAPSRSAMYTGLYPHRNGCHRNHSAVFPETKSMPHYLSQLGYQVALAGKRHIKPRQAFPFKYMKQQDVDRFLTEVGGSPFCLVVASHQPHAPHQTGGYDPADMQIPPYLVDTPETRHTMAAYYTDVDILDREIGECLDLLRQHEVEENTLFIYASDHGTGFPFAKWTVYDAGLHVPFVAQWPGRTEPGTVTDALMSFVDVLPTCIDIAGGAPPRDLDGRSLLPVLLGEKREHGDAVFGAHTTQGIISGSVFPIRAIRTRTHKYIRNLNSEGTFTNVVTNGRERKVPGRESGPAKYWLSWIERAKTDAFAAERVKLYQHRPAEELYDLRTDPYEMKNLTGDPAQKELLADLRKRLDEWMKQQGDPLAE